MATTGSTYAQKVNAVNSYRKRPVPGEVTTGALSEWGLAAILLGLSHIPLALFCTGGSLTEGRLRTPATNVANAQKT